MNGQTWLGSNVDYGRKLVESGLAGANSGGREFLGEEPLRRFLQESMRRSLKLAAALACLGTIGACLSKPDRKRASNALIFGVGSAALGFVGGLTWETRRFLASAGRRAVKDVKAARDEHWFEKNPIDYA